MIHIAAKQKKIRTASSYDQWKAVAQAHDQRSGAAAWRERDETSRYDYKAVRRRYDELNDVCDSGDPFKLRFFLNEGIHGNMGRMGSSSLYRRAKFGTKTLVTNFIAKLAEALKQLAAADESKVSLHEKREFFDRASHCFGRSALMMSGAGSLGPFHIGVVKALLEEDLLPTVLSGSSAGSFVSAVVGTHNDDEVIAQLSAEDLTFGAVDEPTRVGQQLKIREVREFVAAMIPDMTFQEAYEHTGRKINITVSPRELHQTSRLLNAITSPNVYIREAVLASCAIPGIFPPVTLAAKNVRGHRQPYIPSRKWVDGSVSEDLPVRRLTRLYGVNHFITSQTNPIALGLIREKDDSIEYRFWHVMQTAQREWARATFPIAMDLTRNLYPLNLWTRMGYSVAMQDYTADINILPTDRNPDPRKLLAHLTAKETHELIRQGELSTWPKIEMIRNCTLIARTLDEIVEDLDDRLS